MDLSSKINNFRETGLEIFSDIIDKKLCESYIAKLEKILELRNNDNEYIGDKTNQVLYTFLKKI